MVHKVKRGICIAVIASLFIALGLGCSNKTDETAKQNQPIELKWVLPGDKQVDADDVWAEFNQQLKDYLPNVKADFEMIPISNYVEKWKMMASAGEQVDIAWNGWMQNFVLEAKSGMYLELDDLINQQAPGIAAELPDWLFDKARVGGKIYCVPNYQMMTDFRISLASQKEVADQFMDRQKIHNSFTATDTTTSEQYAILEDYMKTLKENNKLKMGLGATAFIQLKGYEIIISNAYIEKYGTSYKVYDLVDIPQLKEFIFIMKNWYDQGYIRKDTLTAKDSSANNPQEYFSVWMANYLDASEELSAKNDKITLAYVPLEKNYYISSGASATNTVIPRTCKDPEKSIKLIELMNIQKGKPLYNTLVYGIEGKHYTKVNENTIETKADIRNTSKAPYAIPKWAVGNTFNAYETQYDPEGYNNYIKNEVNGKADKSPILGFQYDLTNVTNEVSQCDAILKEYFVPLLSGGIGNDTEKMYNEFVAKMKKAGSEKIVDELQRQINDWILRKKK